MSVNAFDCIPVIDSLHEGKIECIECCGQELYLGSSDGLVIVYTLEDGGFSSRFKCSLLLPTRKAVRNIKAASALQRLLVLSNSCLFLLELESLEIVGGGPQLQGVTTFAVNENPNTDDPFATQICVAERKRLRLMNVSSKKLSTVAELPTSEPARELAVDGVHVCVALQRHYRVFNLETRDSQELFEFDGERFTPIVCRITKGEFLVTAPEGLGMFVTPEGVSNRPPIQWHLDSRLLALAYYHPYVLGLGSNFVLVHSILDQQQKQALPFSGGVTLGNFDGRLYLGSVTSVCCLRPVPCDQQVEVLLADGRVDEALELAENANRAGLTQEQFERLYLDIQRRAAFIFFTRQEFDKAREMVLSSDLDVRELISLFPALLPARCTFLRSSPPLHHIADVDQLFHKDPAKLREARIFLQRLLAELRDSSANLAHQYEVDTALIKLYAGSSREQLEAFLLAGDAYCDHEECLELLERLECFHALALLHRQLRRHEAALDTWARLVRGEIHDSSFPGARFLVEQLAQVQDEGLVWRYAGLLLGEDEESGVEIFTRRSSTSDKLKPDLVSEFLHKYPRALARYLEHLVFQHKTVDEKYHTHLAVLYFESIMKLRGAGQSEEEMRRKFLRLLQESSLYRAQFLLGKVKGSGLDLETATLYGKLGEHDKALEILVHRLRDYAAAERYCELTGGRDKKQRKAIYHALLSCYLNPHMSCERRNELIEPALGLLTRHSPVFDSSRVLELLPQEWSVTIVSSFLRGALRASLHQYRLSQVESALCRGENFQRRFALYDLHHNSIHIQESNYCSVCKKPFVDVAFARYPNNVITHIACAKHNDVCPLTGKVFRMSNS